MKKCPRCKRKVMKIPIQINALSRRDNKTYICSDCGAEEALIDAKILKSDEKEIKFSEKIFRKKEEI